jgi:hypothetical protein
MKQTSTEWLSKELESYGDPDHCKIEWEALDALIEQAKEMEKEQIAQSFEDGEYNYFYSKEDGKDFENGFEYYNEKFKQQKQ